MDKKIERHKRNVNKPTGLKVKNMNDTINNDNREDLEIQNDWNEQQADENIEINETSVKPEFTQNSDDTETPPTGEEYTENIDIEAEKETGTLEAGEVFETKKTEVEEAEEVQQLHCKHAKPQIPIIDHRILAGKLTVYDWLSDIPEISSASEIVEVRFKNTRKAFFSNPAQLKLETGDIVAVETALGHDIGVVSLSGELVKEQIRQKKIDLERNPLKKVYRKAKPHDIEKWQQAIAMEHETMIRSRKIAADLKLNMKIGDVEYQGDKTKAIFYYISEDRVDFRALIKVLAETFHIRIEMKQIGARQEAGRIGGIGPCGQKLCCSTFITNFISVSTSAARYQDISLNPQKLAGQCGKLKCCLNYEVDAYIDAQKDFPSTNLPLNTGEGMLYHQKTDIFGRTMSYAFDKDGKGIFIQIPVKRVKEIISMNRKGIIPPKAIEITEEAPVDIKYTDGVGEESLSRFDEKRQNPKNRKNRNNNGGNRNNENNGNNRTERNSGDSRNERSSGDMASRLNKKPIINPQENKSNENNGTNRENTETRQPDNTNSGNNNNNGNNNNRQNNNNRSNSRPNPRRDPRRDQRRDPKPGQRPEEKTDQKTEQKPE